MFGDLQDKAKEKYSNNIVIMMGQAYVFKATEKKTIEY